MSIQAVGWVLDHSPSKGYARLVMISIANNADKAGRNCQVSYTTIGEEAGISRRQAIRLAKELEAAGEISIRVNASARYGTNVYTILGMQRARATGDQVSPLEPEEPPAGGIAPGDSPSPLGPQASGDNQSPLPSASGDSRGDNRGDTAVSPEPLTHGPKDSATPPAPRPRDAVWDALVEAIRRGPETDNERGAWNRQVASMRKALGYVPDHDPARYAEIRLAMTRRIREFRRQFSWLTLAPGSLDAKFGQCGPPVEAPPLVDAPAPVAVADVACPDCGRDHASMSEFLEAHPERRPSWKRRAS